MQERLLKLERRFGEQHLEALIDVVVTHSEAQSPSLSACRYAVLPLADQPNTTPERPPTVIYDRLLNRIVDGVYYMPLDEVLEIARAYHVSGWQDVRAPNGDALGLLYPPTEG